MDTQTKTFQGVTLHGLPVQIEMQWPFHASEGGSDWYVVHGSLRLADGGPLHADIALNLSQTILAVLSSLDSEMAFAVAVNTARKALDDKQLELLKSGKRQPVPVSSRTYSIRHKRFTFGPPATPEQIADLVARKVYWVSGSSRQPVLITDPCDALYLDAADPAMMEKLAAAAKEIAARGLIEFDGQYATATNGLVAQTSSFIAAKDSALNDLQAKHAYERA